MTSRLQPGDDAPDFTLTTADAEKVALGDMRGRKVILYFYPAASTPGCTTQACDFRDNMASLQGAGYRVFGVSPDSPAKLKRFQESESLTFPLLSDPDHAVHEAYGTWGEKNVRGRMVTGVLRSTFVLDESGVIQHALYNVRATGHVAALRRRLGVDA